jgi:hypothetical protein
MTSPPEQCDSAATSRLDRGVRSRSGFASRDEKQMTLATLMVAALGAAFTALAAGAALWTARTGRDEARLRSQPYVATSPPSISFSGDEIEIALKNLGLGPARLLAFLLEHDGQAVGAYTSPGLAPMEEETIAIPLALWTAVDPPGLDHLQLAGQCQDAMGHVQPLYVEARRGLQIEMRLSATRPSHVASRSSFDISSSRLSVPRAATARARPQPPGCAIGKQSRVPA